jgi:OOP family OmpA-OmpF porin
MSYIRLLAAGILLVEAFAVAEASAALRPNTLTLSPRAGAYLFERGEDLENAPVYSLGVGYQFSSNWSSELHGAYLETRQETSDQENVRGYVGRMEVLYHFRPESNLVPHLAAGLGFLALDRSGSINADGFAGYGFGVQYFFTPDISFSLDGRHQFRETDDFTASAGLGYCFGSEEKDPRIIDSDGDGVIDVFDRCPGTRLGIPVDGYGCPADSDRDGVFDYLDKCPVTPAGAGVDAAGCPPDADGDGIADDRDRCPGTAAGAAVDADGCPQSVAGETGGPTPLPGGEREPVVIPLPFALGVAELPADGAARLQPAIRFLQEHPAATFVVEAHTDSIGVAEKNLRLSQRRAEAVRRFLIEQVPVAPERIRALGLGESQPIADEGTPEGRVQNRRIVVRLQAGD